MAIQGWIWSRNLVPFVSMLGPVVGCRIDDEDILAIEAGVKDTDDERGKWFTYELTGNHPVGLQFARCVGGDEVVVRVEGMGVSAGVDALILVAQSFSMLPARKEQ